MTCPKTQRYFIRKLSHALHVRQCLGVGGDQIMDFAISPVWAWMPSTAHFQLCDLGKHAFTLQNLN